MGERILENIHHVNLPERAIKVRMWAKTQDLRSESEWEFQHKEIERIARGAKDHVDAVEQLSQLPFCNAVEVQDQNGRHGGVLIYPDWP